MTVRYLPPSPIGATKAGVGKFAEDVAQQLGFAAGSSIEDLVAAVGGNIIVGSSGFGDDDSGSIIARTTNDFDIFVSRHTSLTRDRFTIAHELGHLALHLPGVKAKEQSAFMRATRYVDPQDANQQRAEWEANWFAASFLMPTSEFKSAFGRGGSPEAARVCGVSVQAAEIRAKNLGLSS